MYKPPRSFLRWRTPLELLVATVLSARCTDAQVNRTTAALFRKYRKAEDYCAAKRRDIERAIRSCGTYRVKAKHVQGLCQVLLERHGGRVPCSMAKLLELPGVGRKTAAIVLSVAFERQEGIAVDTHVFRLARRLGLSKANTQGGVEKDLMGAIPRERWGEVNALFISHGRFVCAARRPKCGRCVLGNGCPRGGG